jgi:flagellar hook-length control protein FliK
VNNKQVVAQQLIDADLLSDDVNNIATSSKGERLAVNIGDKVNKETIAHQPINLAKLTENVAIDSLDEHKKTVEINQQSQNKNPQQLVNTDVESKLEKLSNETTADNKNKNVQQVSIEANKNNSLGDIAATEKSAANIETTANVKNSAQPAINASMVSVTQSTMSQSTAAQNLASQVASKNTVAITGNTATETVAKESTSIEPEIELSAEYAEQLIEQSKAGSVDKDKNSNTIVKPTTSRDTSLSETNFIGDANRTTQATDDRVTQQSADAFNLTGSAEVTQPQKTTTQLHQETFSNFRRDFSDAVKDKVMLMISQKLQQFDITLDPPELGNMQVRVNLQGEQATVNFVVQNQQAKESIEQNMHKLKDLLAEQGVDVGDANVEQQSQQSDTEGNKNESAKGNTNSLLQNTADANDVVQRDLSAVIHDSSAKGIDYYA